MKSVLWGTDAQALPLLLSLHCAVETPRILDVTANRGVMWQGLPPYDLTTLDINPAFAPDVVGDFRALPFADASFDVLVFDPPHLPAAAASPNSSRLWADRYGITEEHTPHADAVSSVFAPFLAEARRVLVSDGIVLAKLADLVHTHAYQWQHVDFVLAVRQAGMTPCDLLVKVDPNAGHLRSSRWVNEHHLRKAHCYWIVVRNSARCENPAHREGTHGDATRHLAARQPVLWEQADPHLTTHVKGGRNDRPPPDAPG